MNECRRISPLLHLHRPGELTERERRLVTEHLRQCAACRLIAGELETIEGALGPVRAEVVNVNSSPALVNGTLDRLRARETASFFDVPALRWARPGLGLAMAIAATLFFLQVSRDGAKIATLEEHLSAQRAEAAPTLEELEGEAASLASRPRLAGASLPDNPLAFLAPGLRKLLGRKDGLFENLARKYPNLSTITPEDGYDERERAILATEGKAFLDEVQRLLREGDRP